MTLIEKPAGQIDQEKALVRVQVTERQGEQWNAPIIAQSEEVPFLEATVLGPRMAAGIRHIVTEEHDADRIRGGLACPQCLTPFPAPANLRHIATWRALGSERWNWGSVELRDHGLALVAQGCCPVCGFEQSPEMLAAQEMAAGPRDTDAEWNDYTQGFEERAEAYFEKTERRRSGRSTGYKPRGGFLQHRPIRTAFDQAKGG